MGVRYHDKKDAIRTELLRCAAGGAVITYTELGRAVGIPKQGPWKAILDIISGEETGAKPKRPDITYLVVSGTTGYSSQIQFKGAKRPTPEQIQASERVQREAWDHYAAPT